MARSFLKVCGVAFALMAFGLVTACGGGGGDPSGASSATVTGVDTPSSVSVVTAKNAN